MLECGNDGEIYVLGFERNYDAPIDIDDEDGDEAAFSNSYFISKLENDILCERHEITEDVYDFYHSYKKLQSEGFTDKSKEWSGFKYKNVDITGIEGWNISLEQLWKDKSKE